MSNNELQNNEFVLPGGLGTIQVGSQLREIESIFNGKDGSCTITIGEKKAPLIIDGKEIEGLKILLPKAEITIEKGE